MFCLLIGYKLEKVGRSYKNIVFTVKPQALATPLNFDLDAAIPTSPGIPQDKHDLAVRTLDELQIIDKKHRQAILTNPDLIAEVNAFSYKLKTGKIVPSKNPGGLLLTLLGLVKAKQKPA